MAGRVTFAGRWAAFALVFLICVDQLLQTIFVGTWWWLTGRGHVPDPDETISGFLGRHMALGHGWATFPAALTDALFLALTLGRERHHCLRVFVHESGINEKGAG